MRGQVAAVFTQLRERRGEWLTQGRLAELTGIDPSYISRIERGERSPSLDMLAKLAPAYGLDPLELVRAVYEVRLPAAPPPPASPMLALAAALEAGPWNPTERGAIIALCDSLRQHHGKGKAAFDKAAEALLAEAEGHLDAILATEGAAGASDWLAARLTSLSLDLWGPDSSA